MRKLAVIGAVFALAGCPDQDRTKQPTVTNPPGQTAPATPGPANGTGGANRSPNEGIHDETGGARGGNTNTGASGSQGETPGSRGDRGAADANRGAGSQDEMPAGSQGTPQNPR